MRETGLGPVTTFSRSVRSGSPSTDSVDRHPEPAAGVRPVLLGGGCGDAERGGRLLGGEAGEEPELDQLGLPRVLRFELAGGPRPGRAGRRRRAPPGPARRRRGRAGGVRPRPCRVCLCRARSTRMRRMASAAAAKKWPRPSQPALRFRRPAAGTPREPARWLAGSGRASPRPAAPRRACAVRRRRAATVPPQRGGRRPPRRRECESHRAWPPAYPGTELPQ